jgi:hypothetical protein
MAGRRYSTIPDALAAMLGTKKILASLLKDREFTLKELNPHIAESRMSQQAFRLCAPCLSELSGLRAPRPG